MWTEINRDQIVFVLTDLGIASRVFCAGHFWSCKLIVCELILATDGFDLDKKIRKKVSEGEAFGDEVW